VSVNFISASTRVEFREALSSFVLREINDLFEVGQFEPNLQYQPPVGGQRRTLVEQYFANIDLSNPRQVRRVLVVFEELIFRLNTSPNGKSSEVQQLVAKLLGRMQRDGFQFQDGKFACPKLIGTAVSAPLLIALTQDSIAEHIEKANAKIESGDAAGAITSAYTLVEGFLKQVYKTAVGASFKESEGDIRTLYGAVAERLNLAPKGESLESYLKAILQGNVSQIGGLYELANKASDRHARKYNPARHHAQLAVNTAFTLCEFVLASYHYQQAKKSTKAWA
jgi:hypothetical protein